MKPYLLLLFIGFYLVNCSQGSKQKVDFVIIHTDFGDMKAKLYDSTPKHKANFLKLVKEGYYDDLLFHRVIKQFMIQGGDPESRTSHEGLPLGQGGPGYTIEPEIGKFHFKGALSAARLGDQVNPGKLSSGSQFFIVDGQKCDSRQVDMMGTSKGMKYSPEDYKKYETLGGTPFLDGDYTVFGEIVEGLDVIDKITAQPCDQANRPNQNIRMTIKIVN